MTALTKMFEKKNSIKERRTTHTTLTPASLLEDVALSARDINVENDNLESSRKRGNSILDKISMFNKNVGSSKTVKKSEEISTLPLQSYVKIVDEQTGKTKWVEGANSHRSGGEMTNRKRVAEEGESVMSESKPSDGGSSSNLSNVETISVKKVGEIIKQIEDKAGDTNPMNIKTNESNESSENNEVNTNAREVSEPIPEEKDSKFSESVNNLTNSQNDAKTEEFVEEESNEDDEIEVEDDSSDRIEMTIRKNTLENETNVLSNNTNTSIEKEVKSPPKQDNKNTFFVETPNNKQNKGGSPAKSPEIQFKKFKIDNANDNSNQNNVEKEALDDFFTSINYQKENFNKMLEKENINIINFNENVDKKEKPKNILLSSESDESSSTKREEVVNSKADKKDYKNQYIIDLVEEKVSPQLRKKTNYAEKNEYNEVFNHSVNNPDTVVNMSNVNVSQNYNSLFNTVRTGLNDNILFSDNKRRNDISYSEGGVKEVKKLSEDEEENKPSQALLNLILNNKLMITIILVVFIVIILILLTTT